MSKDRRFTRLPFMAKPSLRCGWRRSVQPASH
jgi:hypothetical protein